MEANRWYIGDAFELAKQLPDDHVQCIVTSPPYWNLRDYGIDGQLGLEKTPEEYVEKMVTLFRELRRGLRDDGTLWLNLGDSYANTGNPGQDFSASKVGYGGKGRGVLGGQPIKQMPPGLKPKDLVGIPWRVAFALQADGWYLRQDIIWHKPNPMPESVTDRCTKAHEYLFLLTKSPRYFYDAEAIKEPTIWINDTRADKGRIDYDGKRDGTKGQGQRAFVSIDSAGRNRRSVWKIPTAPYPNAHFATFPPKLVEPCIQAGTSAEGCCPTCGKPWNRITEKDRKPTRPGLNTKCDAKTWDKENMQSIPGRLDGNVIGNRDPQRHVTETKTIGFEPQCTHDKKPIGCIVLDPFAGSGTTLEVAHKHGRRWIGFELSEEYAKLIESRMKPLIQQGTLF